MWNLCKIPFDVLWYHQICVKSPRDNHHVIYHHIFSNIYIFFDSGGNLLLFRDSVMFDYLQLHGMQHIMLPCPSPSLGGCSNSCLLSQWCHPTISSSVDTFSSCLQSFPDLSQNQVFSNESVPCIRSPKYWSFSISPFNEYSVLTSFTVDWFDLLAVQGTFKSLQYHNSKASILQYLAFFMVQLSHPFMTTGKAIALTI